MITALESQIENQKAVCATISMVSMGVFRPSNYRFTSIAFMFSYCQPSHVTTELLYTSSMLVTQPHVLWLCDKATTTHYPRRGAVVRGAKVWGAQTMLPPALLQTNTKSPTDWV